MCNPFLRALPQTAPTRSPLSRPLLQNRRSVGLPTLPGGKAIASQG